MHEDSEDEGKDEQGLDGREEEEDSARYEKGEVCKKV